MIKTRVYICHNIDHISAETKAYVSSLSNNSYQILNHNRINSQIFSTHNLKLFNISGGYHTDLELLHDIINTFLVT